MSNSSIRPIHRTLSGVTNRGYNRPASNGNGEVLHAHQSSWTVALPTYCVVSHQGHLLQGVLPLCRGAVGILYSHHWLGLYVHVYIYIYIYPSICVYIYIYMRSCVYRYMHVYVYACIYMYMHVYVYVYACICIYMHICVCVHMHKCIYIYMHMNIYLHILSIYCLSLHIYACNLVTVVKGY